MHPSSPFGSSHSLACSRCLVHARPSIPLTHADAVRGGPSAPRPVARATFFAFHGDKPRGFSCFWPLGPSVGCGTVPAGRTPAVGACVRGAVDDVRVVPTSREGFLTRPCVSASWEGLVVMQSACSSRSFCLVQFNVSWQPWVGIDRSC